MNDQAGGGGPNEPGNIRIISTERAPTEAEIAKDLKERMTEAFKPVLELMDEANRHGLLFRWDAAGPAPPLFKNQVIGIRIERHY